MASIIFSRGKCGFYSSAASIRGRLSFQKIRYIEVSYHVEGKVVLGELSFCSPFYLLRSIVLLS